MVERSERRSKNGQVVWFVDADLTRLAVLSASDSATLLQALAWFAKRAAAGVTPEERDAFDDASGFVPSEVTFRALLRRDLLAWRDDFGWVPSERGAALAAEVA